MKTVSVLGQYFRTCLPAIADRQASTALGNPLELPPRKVGADRQDL